MKHFIVLALLFVSFSSLAQHKSKLSLVAQLQPELTTSSTHYNDFLGTQHYSRFNIGFTLATQYKLGDRWWLEGGLGFISRGVALDAPVDQQRLPPPYYDTNALLRVTYVARYRTLQFPLGMGYNFTIKRKADFFAKLTFIPNFLLNAHYRNDYPSFKKNCWQGYSLNAGLGFDYRLSKKLKLTSSLAYSFVNTSADDPYIDGDQIKQKHKYIQLSTGVKLGL